MVNVKKKGNLWENKLANWLSSHGFRSFKDGASGGGTREKGDIVNGLDMTIESKACKKVELMKWWKQVDENASQQRNQPVLFVHVDGMPDNEWLVTMHSEDWIELVKGEDKRDQTFTNPKAKYAVQTAKNALQTVLKHFEV